jgi:succinate dehydrogenase / fumarate reductase, flavoprotein subunit
MPLQGKAIKRSLKNGNLFEMYEKITGEDPYKTPMRIYPAVHYTMGGLWVDYNLQSTIPGLFVLGEANFSDHGANRLGASALMQGLADGYFIIPYTLGNYLANNKLNSINDNHQTCQESRDQAKKKLDQLLSIKGKKTVGEFHKQLGLLMWDHVGMSRSEPNLKKVLEEIPKLKREFWQNVCIPGENNYKNSELERAGRVADFLELGELMARDALERKESCGGHFREEYQTPENEALRDDKDFCHVSAWEYKSDQSWTLHKEPLKFEEVHLTARSYK